MLEASERARNLEKSFREYAWNYFQQHAEQRLKSFQFYITLTTAILGGALLLLRFGQAHKWIAVLGALLAFLSFVFWKLDVRTRGMVKNGEAALKFLDAEHQLPTVNDAPHPLAIIARDDYFVAQQKQFPLWSGHFSYRRCFNYVFTAFALIGLAGCIAALIWLPLTPEDSSSLHGQGLQQATCYINDLLPRP